MRRFVTLLAVPTVLLPGAVTVWLVPTLAVPRLDVAEANDLLTQARATWPHIGATYLGDQMIATGGSVVASSSDPIITDLEAARQGALGFDIMIDSRVVDHAWLGSGRQQRWATA